MSRGKAGSRALATLGIAGLNGLFSQNYLQLQKKYAMKNTIISSKSKIINFIGKTFPGSTHDHTMLKKEFSPELPWSEEINALSDLGYQGIRSDYAGYGIWRLQPENN